jgi:hypothetical protein
MQVTVPILGSVAQPFPRFSAPYGAKMAAKPSNGRESYLMPQEPVE